MKYLVTLPHRSEYPDPIHLNKGDPLVIGKNTRALKIGMTGFSVPRPATLVDGRQSK